MEWSNAPRLPEKRTPAVWSDGHTRTSQPYTQHPTQRMDHTNSWAYT